MTIKELREKRESYLATARAIIDGAVHDNRELSSEEKRDHDGLCAKVDAINETLKRHARLSDLNEELAQPLNEAIRPDVGYGARALRPGEVRMLKPSEKLVDVCERAPGADGVSLGRIVRGIATGNWAGAELERRIMSEAAPGSAGGYFVPTPLSSWLIDRARAQSVIFKAGAMTVPMESSTLKIARLAGDPTAGWKAENDAATASDMTFECVTFTARTLVALCKLSIELFEDSQNIDQVVSDSISKALAGELDRVGLVGSIAPEPQGIYGATNVQTVAVDGELTSYIPFVQAFGAILGANGTYNATVINPREWTCLQSLYDSYSRPLYPPTSWLELSDPNGRDGLKVSTQIPINLGTGEDESIAIVGDFTQLLVGVRTQIMIEASRQAADAVSSAFSNMQVWVRAYLRADIQLAHPEHFCVLTGITPAA